MDASLAVAQRELEASRQLANANRKDDEKWLGNAANLFFQGLYVGCQLLARELKEMHPASKVEPPLPSPF